MDQNFISGLGNIYVNEALYLSKISPNRRGKNISLKKCYDLIKNIKTILKNAIKEAILDGIIANKKKEAFQFLIKKAAEIGLKPKK